MDLNGAYALAKPQQNYKFNKQNNMRQPNSLGQSQNLIPAPATVSGPHYQKVMKQIKLN